MKITAVKTNPITANSVTLLQLLDKYLNLMPEKSVLALTSKVVSLCEGRAIPSNKVHKIDLVKQESQYYLPSQMSKYGFNFTITNDTFIPGSGIDESNTDGNYVLWPADVQKTANQVRAYLKKRFNLKEVGVIITDSTHIPPLRLGALGIFLAHSGFQAVNDYVGQSDLFGRPFAFSKSGIASGLAASAVLVMGEGNEQTPLAVLEDLSFVTFQAADPTPQELEARQIPLDDDIFAPFFDAVDWLPGDKLGK